jgi:hypothetical protein
VGGSPHSSVAHATEDNIPVRAAGESVSVRTTMTPSPGHLTAEYAADERWASAPAGAGGGEQAFVGGPGVPFVRNRLTENPGRTIYSQQRLPNR